MSSPSESVATIFRMPDDIQFFGDPEAPQPPPDDVRVTDYRVMPWPDGTRVTVEMGLTQFRVFPAMDISIATPDGEVLRQISCVGALERRPAPTLHLPRLDRGAALLAVIEMLHGDDVRQRVVVPFAVAGPIIKAAVAEDAPGPA